MWSVVFFSLLDFLTKKKFWENKIQMALRLLIAVWLNRKKGGLLVLNF